MSHSQKIALLVTGVLSPKWLGIMTSRFSWGWVKSLGAYRSVRFGPPVKCCKDLEMDCFILILWSGMAVYPTWRWFILTQTHISVSDIYIIIYILVGGI